MIPHARHGGNGVCTLAVAGSKFDGREFENEHIGHIQVTFCCLEALDTGDTPRCGLALRAKRDAVGLRDGAWLEGEDPGVLDPLRNCIDDLLLGLGYNVILADDLRNPACGQVSRGSYKGPWASYYIEFICVHILELDRCRVLAWLRIINIADTVRCQIDMTILVAGDLKLPRLLD